jgi:hypothetical protein
VRAVKRWILLAVVAVVIVLAITIYRTEPPRLLSILDGVMGGGRGTRQMGDGIAFDPPIAGASRARW